MAGPTAVTASSPDVEPARFVELQAHFVDGGPTDRAHIRSVIEDPETAALLRARAAWYEIQLDRERGEGADPGAARPLDQRLRRLGVLLDWEVIGPFDLGQDPAPGSSSSVEADWMSGHSALSRYAGKEHDVAWHGAGLAARFGVLDVGAVSHNAVPGVLYGRTAFSVSNPIQGALRLGVSVPYLMWLDGRMIAVGQTARPAVFDQDAVPIHLAPGPHRLLVKLWARNEPVEVMARLSDVDGAPLRFEPIEHSAGPHPAATSASNVRPRALADPVATIEARYRAHLDDSEVAWIRVRLLEMLRPSGIDAPALEAAWRAAILIGPNRVDRLIRAAASARGDRRRNLLEQALALDPRSADAHRGLALHLDSQGLHRLARNHWARRLELVGEDPMAELAAVAPLARIGLATTHQTRLMNLYKRHPRQIEVALQTADALIAADRLGDAEPMLRAVLEAHAGDPRPYARLEHLHRRRGAVAPLLETLAAGRRWLPFSTEAWIRGASALFGNDQGDGQRRAQARNLLEQAIAVAPERPELWSAMGDLLDRADDRAAAIRAWRRSLELAPQQPGLNRRLAYVEGGRSGLVASEPRDVLAAIAAAPSSHEAEAGAYFLFDHVGVQVHPNGLATRHRQYALRLVDGIQKDAVRQHAVSYAPNDERVRVDMADLIRHSGEIRGPSRRWTERPYGKVGGVYGDYETLMLAFDEVEPGDTVHVAWTIEPTARTNVYGGAFGYLVGAQSLFPKTEWSLAIRAPRALVLTEHTAGLPDPTVQTDGDHRTWRWTAAGLGGASTDPRSPPYVERGAYVNVSSFRSWPSIAQWYAQLVAGQAYLDAETIRDVRELVRRSRRGAPAGQSASGALPARSFESIEAIVAGLFEYVVARTRYVGIEFGVHGFKPYAADHVIRRGYGDCKDKANLLVALLDCAGIEAEMVLVRTGDRGHVEAHPPSPWIFNHAVVYVPAMDRYVDPTTEHGGPWELPPLDQDAQAFHVSESRGNRLRSIPALAAETNRTHIEAELRLLDDGHGILTHRETVVGARAEEVRRRFQASSIGRRGLEQIVARAHPGASLLELRVLSVSRDQPAEVEFSARLPRMIRAEANPGEPECEASIACRSEVIVQAFPLGLRPRYASANRRQSPLVIEYPWTETVRLELYPPAGRTFTPPEDVDITTAFGSYRRVAQLAGQRWIITRTLRLDVRRVRAETYQAFRDFCHRVDTADAARGRLSAHQRAVGE